MTKVRKRRPAKHGTIYTYKSGCRCARCRKANTDECRAYRQKCGITDPRNPCRIGSTVHASQAAAARAAGVARSTITYHLNRWGNLDRLGNPPGTRDNGRCKPVRIGPRIWPSQTQLDEYLGVKVGTVSAWIKRGDIERIIEALMLADARNRVAA